MAVVGIDLGTTYSVIGTPQTFEGEFFEQVRGVTIIKDDYKQRINPSVVAIDRAGNILVGRRAKSRVGQQPEPIMFVKRLMGEAKELKLGDKVYLPEQVSAEILSYLKSLAEKKMGQPITEAVITVPAYFSQLQKQKTKEAGEIAGLKVGKILQEPVAAALCYFHDDDRDPLTIMTYDLGGGTFDVAIVKKEGGVFDIKAFDGDPNLGGYDFDKKMAFLILDQLKAQGFSLNITPQSPEWSKVLVLAETIKIKLTDRDIHDMVDPNPGIMDANGEPVSIELQVSRSEFEALISDYIDQTIDFCRRALEKINPPMDYSQIDEIIMVGGSSRIPLVSKKLEAVFNKKPRLVEPELSVGIGATIMAQMLSKQVGPLRLDHLPETTSLSAVQIAGKILPTELFPDIKGAVVILLPTDGSKSRQQPISEQGGFLFENVSLVPETQNTFSLQVKNAGGEELITHTFCIRHEAAAQPAHSLSGLETNILAKPISIMTVSGLQTVAGERKILPCDCSLIAKTMDQSGEVRIPIYEANAPIGEIVVESVPRDLPVGSRVEITLILREDFFIDGKARIPAIGIERTKTIRLPAVVVKDLAHLQDEYFKLKQKQEEALTQADRSQLFRIAPRLKTTLEECQKILYTERDPNLARAQQLLAEAETLIRNLGGWNPEPSQEQFEQLKREIEENLLPDIKAGTEHDNYKNQLNAIAGMGVKALAEKNQLSWADANDRLVELQARINSFIEQEEERKRKRRVGSNGEKREEKPPVPRQIKLKLGMDLIQFREEARRKGRFSELETDFSACDQALKGINADSSDAMNRLVEYYENHHLPLQAKVMGRKTGKSTLPKGLTEILEGGYKKKEAGEVQ